MHTSKSRCALTRYRSNAHALAIYKPASIFTLTYRWFIPPRGAQEATGKSDNLSALPTISVLYSLCATMISTTSAAFVFFFLLGLLNTVSLAAPLNVTQASHRGCEQILERKEWYAFDFFFILTFIINTELLRRALSDEEKKSYIDAVKCLQTQPALNTSQPTSWTRFDEFQAHHIGIATQIHYVVCTYYDLSGCFSSTR